MVSHAAPSAGVRWADSRVVGWGTNLKDQLVMYSTIFLFPVGGWVGGRVVGWLGERPEYVPIYVDIQAVSR